MATSPVIPFHFHAREIRTLLINGLPWFVAQDVAHALGYRDSEKMTRNLDNDEKGTQIVGTRGGEQALSVINESGLYSAILRSRKPEAKRFKKWVTSIVLPAIREHGFYQRQGYPPHVSQPVTIADQTIGTSGFRCLGAVIDGKVGHLPAPERKRVKQHIWRQVHKAYSVVSAKDIPADQLDSARALIAAYAVEGEWLGSKEALEPTFTLNSRQARAVTHLLHHAAWVIARWEQGIGDALDALKSELYANTLDHIKSLELHSGILDRELAEMVDHFIHPNTRRPSEPHHCAPVGSIAHVYR